MVAAPAILWGASAQAQSILWVPLVEEDATVERRIVEHMLVDVLANADEASHIVGLAGLEQRFNNGGFPLPACVQGLATCDSPLDAVLDTLDVDLVIEVVALGDGSELRVTVLDTAIDRSSELVIDADTLRAAIYRTVAELVGATGRVVVQSTPAGATVTIDGVEVGTTPYDTTLTIGDYPVVVSLEGYDAVETLVDLRAGEEILVDPVLEQRYGALTVRTGMVGAEILLDGEVVLTPFEPYALEPGIHTVEMRSPGYNLAREVVEVDRGQATVISMNLELSPFELMRRRRARLRSFPLSLEASLATGAGSTDLAGYEAGSSEVRCDLNEDDDCGGGASFGAHGLQLTARYGWRIAEATLLGLDYRQLTTNDTTWELEDGESLVLDAGHRVVLRLLQPGARYLYQDHLEFYGQTGVAMLWDTLPGTVDEAQVTASRSTMLWELHGGARYHFNSLIYAYVQADLGFDLLGHHSGGLTGVSAGVGFNLADPFGLSGWLNTRFDDVPDPEPTEPPPTEEL